MPAPNSKRRNDGFFNRGETQTRLETFVDAAFAFVITLLVISFDALPKDSTELVNALRGIPAFAASFFLIVQFWWVHNTWCRRYGLDDAPANVLGISLVFLVLIFVYPLRVQFASLFAWISDGFFPSAYRINGLADLQIMFMVFGASFAAMSLVIALLHHHALRRASAIELDTLELAVTRLQIRHWWCNVFVGVLSVLIAASCPDNAPIWRATAGGMVYFVLSFAGPWFASRSMKLKQLHLPS